MYILAIKYVKYMMLYNKLLKLYHYTFLNNNIQI
jgi:hypothetical protein